MAQPKGNTCFTCTAKDGRTVRLYKSTYHGHILREHPELQRDFEHPASQIEIAITTAVAVKPAKGRAVTYIGPTVEARTEAGACRLRVVVNVEEADGWVLTAYPELVFDD